jgi:hypothetical protein
LEAQKPKKRAKVLLFFELTKYFFIFFTESTSKEYIHTLYPSANQPKNDAADHKQHTRKVLDGN